jgi:hypothetical protein
LQLTETKGGVLTPSNLTQEGENIILKIRHEQHPHGEFKQTVHDRRVKPSDNECRRLDEYSAVHAGLLIGSISTLKMEMIFSSETSVHTLTTRHYIPEDGNTHNYR